jgi:hypothetical protein
MLFIIAIYLLQRILDLATQEGLLNPISVGAVKMRTSMYANDAALFVRPIASDIPNLHFLPQRFGTPTCLMVNMQKLKILPI